MSVQVFGHKSPDTDSTGSSIIWAWYLNEIKGISAQARLLGELNTEASFVLNRWSLEKPTILTKLVDNTPVIIVDTNNPAELPENINAADITAIIDHHKLVGGLETKIPIDITVRPLACTATIMYDMMRQDACQMPEPIKGVTLSCILSDTLGFRSPTTTHYDRDIANKLASDLGIDIPSYASEMFQAKSDISAFSDVELLRMDSKKYEVEHTKFRVSVLETTAPKIVLDRKDSLMASMCDVAAEDDVDQVLLFVIDILRKEATFLVPNSLVKNVAKKSFGVDVSGDTVILPGIMSRKKQIIPNLKL